MGYEVLYSFHPREESGEYNKAEVKEMRRKVGSAYDDVPLEKLASTVLSQLARRDIWVVGVQIFEYKRQPVHFRETRGGVVIKNRKFNLDQNLDLVSEEETTPAVARPAQPPVPSTSRRVIKYVNLEENPRIQQEARQSGLHFTPKKRYGVLSERINPEKLGEITYTLVDDRGREVQASDYYFLPADVPFEQPGDKPRLSYENELSEPQMIQLR